MLRTLGMCTFAHTFVLCVGLLAPCVQDAAVAHCWDLPPHTFGGAYAQFMGARGFRADDRPVVR